MTLEVSSRLGPYVVVRRLGGGGMGDVHLVRHERTGRQYALKTLKVGGPDDSHARFSREARILSSMGHPNIVAVHDFDLAADPPWLVTDLLQGRELGEVLQNDGALPLGNALRLFRGIAGAVSAAHAHGVLHRDIKPANVFLVENETRPVLLDFGLAKPTADDATVLTATGVTMGTPAYMSPEQARGDGVDERSDVYSLAATLFEMLTGRPPFEGGNAVSLLARILLEPAPPICSVAAGQLPEEFNPIFARALSKSKNERTESVDAFARELAPWMEAPTAEDDSARHGAIPATRVLSSVRPAAPIDQDLEGTRTQPRRARLAAGAVLLAAGTVAVLIASGAFESRASSVAPLTVALPPPPNESEPVDPMGPTEPAVENGEATDTPERVAPREPEAAPERRQWVRSSTSSMSSAPDPAAMNALPAGGTATPTSSGPPPAPEQSAIDAMAESDWVRCMAEVDRMPTTDRTLQILFSCALQAGDRVKQERACVGHETMFPRHPFSASCRQILDAR